MWLPVVEVECVFSAVQTCIMPRQKYCMLRTPLIIFTRTGTLSLLYSTLLSLLLPRTFK